MPTFIRKRENLVNYKIDEFDNLKEDMRCVLRIAVHSVGAGNRHTLLIHTEIRVAVICSL